MRPLCFGATDPAKLHRRNGAPSISLLAPDSGPTQRDVPAMFRACQNFRRTQPAPWQPHRPETDGSQRASNGGAAECPGPPLLPCGLLNPPPRSGFSADPCARNPSYTCATAGAGTNVHVGSSSLSVSPSCHQHASRTHVGVDACAGMKRNARLPAERCPKTDRPGPMRAPLTLQVGLM